MRPAARRSLSEPCVVPRQKYSNLIPLRFMYRMQAVALLAGLACAKPSAQQPSPVTDLAGRAADHAELLRLHERQRTAHLQRRADWLVGEWADSLFSVSGGRVSVGGGGPGGEEFLEDFRRG